MKTIEFIGPPGVGKSYLIDQSIGNFINNKSKIYRDRDLLSKIPIDKNHDALISYIRWVVYRVLKHPQRQLLNEYGKEFVLDNQSLVEYFWLLLEHRKDDMYPVDTRFLLSSHYVRTFEKIEAIYRFNLDGYCCIDEGLVQRLISLYSDKFNKVEINKYLSKISYSKYRPNAVVCCFADSKLILKRINKRKNMSGSHKGMSDKEIEKFTYGVGIFTSRIAEVLISLGVPVLKLDMSLSLKDKEVALKNFYKKIS